MAKRMLFFLILLIAGLAATACFDLHVESGVDYPAGRFSAALERIALLRSGSTAGASRATALHMLVYDGEERELVSASFPMWLVRRGTKEGEALDRYFDLDSRALQEISRLGPGLLAQVEDEREGTHVLLWLE
ncbi:MAG: hypothetical protein JXO51_09620 [Candidatus Aminicenantes bacterium]|nr:hypothetical protein [Candidatus Aminicenantes bacterium]